MFTLSKDTEGKLEDVFLYRKNELIKLLNISEEEYNNNPKYTSIEGLFGRYSNIDALKENGAKYLTVATPSMRFIDIPLTKQ